MVQSGDRRELSGAGKEIARSLGQGEKKGLPGCEGLAGDGSALGLRQGPWVRGCSETGRWGETSLWYPGPGVGTWEMPGAGGGVCQIQKGAPHQERAEKSRLMALEVGKVALRDAQWAVLDGSCTPCASFRGFSGWPHCGPEADLTPPQQPRGTTSCYWPVNSRRVTGQVSRSSRRTSQCTSGKKEAPFSQRRWGARGTMWAHLPTSSPALTSELGFSPVTRSISSPTSGQGACLMLPDVHQQKGGEAAVLSPPPVPDECLCLATEELLAHTPFYRLLFLILQDWVFQFWFSCPLSASLPFRTALGMVAGARSCITTQIWNCPFLHSPRCLSVLVLSHIRAWRTSFNISPSTGLLAMFFSAFVFVKKSLFHFHFWKILSLSLEFWVNRFLF